MNRGTDGDPARPSPPQTTPEVACGGLPAPAATDDRNAWVDGFCWLYCGQRWTRVLLIGPASIAGRPGADVRVRPMYTATAPDGLAFDPT